MKEKDKENFNFIFENIRKEQFDEQDFLLLSVECPKLRTEKNWLT